MFTYTMTPEQRSEFEMMERTEEHAVMTACDPVTGKPVRVFPGTVARVDMLVEHLRQHS